MTAYIPSVLSKDGTDGLGAVPSVLEESRTDYRGRPSDGTVDNTVRVLLLLPCLSLFIGCGAPGMSGVDLSSHLASTLPVC